jgi:hypothetical protein
MATSGIIQRRQELPYGGEDAWRLIDIPVFHGFYNQAAHTIGCSSSGRNRAVYKARSAEEDPMSCIPDSYFHPD